MLAVMEAAPCLGGVVGFDTDPNVLCVAGGALNKFQSLVWTGVVGVDGRAVRAVWPSRLMG